MSRCWRKLPLVVSGLALVPPVALATPVAPVAQPERKVISPAPDGPAVVYGAADAPVVLVFESRVRGEVSLPGAEVRRHPYRAHALTLTPSGALATQGAAELSVPLEEGVVVLSLVFQPGRADRVVRVVRWPDAPPSAEPQPEVKEGYRAAARAALGQPPQPPPRPAWQQGRASKRVVILRGELLSYVRVDRRDPACAAVSARVRRGRESLEVLLFEPAGGCEAPGVCAFLVVRTREVVGKRFALDLVASDGDVCEEFPVLTLGR